MTQLIPVSTSNVGVNRAAPDFAVSAKNYISTRCQMLLALLQILEVLSVVSKKNTTVSTLNSDYICC